jgi:predicted unusual protein kinase regulating ubiquinone biosynthesis (AarF/ABC1/UbiB family)
MISEAERNGKIRIPVPYRGESVSPPSPNGKKPPIPSEGTINTVVQQAEETVNYVTMSVQERVNAERPRSIRMQYRFMKSLFYALWLFARLIFWDVYVVKYFPRLARGTQMRRWKGYARGFSRYAISMGGVMIKLGQFASTREDILPEEIVRELENLQDEVPSVKYKKIKKVIEAEIGQIDDIFSWINEEPVAAASLGQVHRAQLKDGDRVVVKVQRPNIRGTVYTDLAALFIVAKISMRFSFISRRAEMVGLSEEFGRVLLEEISYETEVRNARKFSRMFRDNMGVYIPAVYENLSTDKVIVLEDVTTIKINDYAALEAKGIDRKDVAQRLLDTYMQQIFEERFFHADPHPGNLFIYPLPVDDESIYIGKGGRPFYLIFIDFGMTGSLTVELTQGIIQTLEAVITQDADKLVTAYEDLGFLLPSADNKRIRQAVQVAFDEVWGMSMADMRDMDFDRAVQIGEQFNDLLFDLPFRVPQDFIYLGRTVGILSGMSTALDPAFNPWTVMQDNMTHLITRGDNNVMREIGTSLTNPMLSMLTSGPQAFFQNIQSLILPGTARLAETENLLRKIVNGEVEIITQPSAKHQKSLNKIESQNRRTTRAVVFVGLLITATLFHTNGDLTLSGLGYGASFLTFLSFILTPPNG